MPMSCNGPVTGLLYCVYHKIGTVLPISDDVYDKCTIIHIQLPPDFNISNFGQN